MTACSSLPAFVAPAAIRLERVSVPAELLVCRPAPARVPRDPWPDNARFAAYVLDVEIAGEDCRGRLAEIRRLMASPP